MISYEEFVADIARAVSKREKFIRYGQAVFNYIEQKYGVAREVQASGLDCFYMDNLADAFMEAAYGVLWNREN